jgi:hypothetical protein
MLDFLKKLFNPQQQAEEPQPLPAECYPPARHESLGDILQEALATKAEIAQRNEAQGLQPTPGTNEAIADRCKREATAWEFIERARNRPNPFVETERPVARRPTGRIAGTQPKVVNPEDIHSILEAMRK